MGRRYYNNTFAVPYPASRGNISPQHRSRTLLIRSCGLILYDVPLFTVFVCVCWDGWQFLIVEKKNWTREKCNSDNRLDSTRLTLNLPTLLATIRWIFYNSLGTGRWHDHHFRKFFRSHFLSRISQIICFFAYFNSRTDLPAVCAYHHVFFY